MIETEYNPEDYESPEEDYDDDLDDDDDIDWEAEEEEVLREQEEKKKEEMSNFSQGVFQPSSPWTTQPTGGSTYSPWGTTQQPRTTPTGAWQWNTTPQTPGYYQTAGYQWNTQTQQQGNFQIDRSKRVIMTDLLDCLISSLDAQGRPGIEPRGIYDIYIRRDVIDKIRCFGPQWIVILTNRGFARGTQDEVRFTRMTDYICACVSDLVGLPLGNVQCIAKATLDPLDPYCKPRTGLLKVAMDRLKEYGIQKKDVVILGSQSGNPGQSGRDFQMAEAAKIDYIDIQQLLTLYR